ncbi:hypothetical protein [Nocardioides luteus]|uniref:hypothetical protein n=1 Tax=Nocardioides luteus TaxID=1844 RepID=UPI001A1A16FB|nr:hypothetical protein [Nocardioides luteus]MBG6096878.1 galactose-1-phosphate uridylyltransferase [Nocardioides luteus]
MRGSQPGRQAVGRVRRRGDETAAGVDALYDAPTPYIAAWQQVPVRSHRDSVRLTLQLTGPRRGADKLKDLAWSEAALEAWVAEIPPEHQAERMREAIARADEDNPV